jgi:hypothetical protein
MFCLSLWVIWTMLDMQNYWCYNQISFLSTCFTYSSMNCHWLCGIFYYEKKCVHTRLQKRLKIDIRTVKRKIHNLDTGKLFHIYYSNQLIKSYNKKNCLCSYLVVIDHWFYLFGYCQTWHVRWLW